MIYRLPWNVFDREMASRMCSKLCCGQKWLLLLSALFFILLTVSVITLSLLLPLPPADIGQQPSYVFSSAQDLISRPRVVEPPSSAVFHSGSWQANTGLDIYKHSVLTKPLFDTVRDEKNIMREQHTHIYKSKGIISMRKNSVGVIWLSSRRHHPNPTQFRVNNTETTPIAKPQNRSVDVKYTSQTHTSKRSKAIQAHIPTSVGNLSDRQGYKLGGPGGNRQTIRTKDKQAQISHKKYHPKKHLKETKKVSKEQQAVNMLLKKLKKHPNLAEDYFEVQKNPWLLDHRKNSPSSQGLLKENNNDWCRRFAEQDFTDNGYRSIGLGKDFQPLPWFSEDDIQKMVLLAEGEVVSSSRVPAHGQILQVALNHAAHQKIKDSARHHAPVHEHHQTHSELCQQGHCSLIKRTEDWFEVFAFHLDRVLGLNRSLPAVLRTFQSEILPYRYCSGTPRPVLWWDPDIQHLSDRDNDQNSVSLSWVHYQKLLQVHCGSSTKLRSAPCVGVHHSEWGRLGLFDFLLQVTDRLDRYCCGFIPDQTDVCVEDLLYTKCGSNKNLLLVHILVRKEDPSRLVFIDNAGRPQQPTDNLNFRLLEGIDQFPEKAVSVLQSGCLGNLLLGSLHTDKEFWDSRGGAQGLRPIIHMIEERAEILLQHIRDNKVRLMRDL